MHGRRKAPENLCWCRKAIGVTRSRPSRSSHWHIDCRWIDLAARSHTRSGCAKKNSSTEKRKAKATKKRENFTPKKGPSLGEGWRLPRSNPSLRLGFHRILDLLRLLPRPFAQRRREARRSRGRRKRVGRSCFPASQTANSCPGRRGSLRLSRLLHNVFPLSTRIGPRLCVGGGKNEGLYHRDFCLYAWNMMLADDTRMKADITSEASMQTRFAQTRRPPAARSPQYQTEFSSSSRIQFNSSASRSFNASLVFKRSPSLSSARPPPVGPPPPSHFPLLSPRETLSPSPHGGARASSTPATRQPPCQPLPPSIRESSLAVWSVRLILLRPQATGRRRGVPFLVLFSDTPGWAFMRRAASSSSARGKKEDGRKIMKAAEAPNATAHALNNKPSRRY